MKPNVNKIYDYYGKDNISWKEIYEKISKIPKII